MRRGQAQDESYQGPRAAQLGGSRPTVLRIGSRQRLPRHSHNSRPFSFTHRSSHDIRPFNCTQHFNGTHPFIGTPLGSIRAGSKTYVMQYCSTDGAEQLSCARGGLRFSLSSGSGGADRTCRQRCSGCPDQSYARKLMSVDSNRAERHLVAGVWVAVM